MTIFANLFEEKRNVNITEKRSRGPADDFWYQSAWMASKDEAAINVNQYTSLNHDVVFACITLRQDTIALFPLHLYERLSDDKGKRRAIERPLYRIFNQEISPGMSANKWQRMVENDIGMWGNHFLLRVLDTQDRIKGCIRLEPLQMEIEFLRGQDGFYEKIFIYTDSNNVRHRYTSKEVFHYFDFSLNGFVGISPITCARESIELGLSVKRFGLNFFRHGAKSSGVIECPTDPGPEKEEELKKAYEKNYGGLGKQHGFMLMVGGMKYVPTSVAQKDSQYLETMQFSTPTLARYFGRIPLHLIDDLTKSSFNNIEEQGRSFLLYSIQPRLVSIEQELNNFFLKPSERGTFFFKFDTSALLKANIAERYAAYNIARTNGWMNADEIRSKEQMNKMPGKQGSVYLAPMNMTNLEFLIEEPEPKPVVEKIPQAIEEIEDQEEDEKEKKDKDEDEKRFLVRAKKPLAEQDYIYLLHHIHAPKKAEDMEELHHCQLYEKKNMKGTEFYQKHVKDGKIFWHAIDTEKAEDVPHIIYCHLNNEYKVKVKTIDNEDYAIITGMVSLKDTKWSEQDRNKVMRHLYLEKEKDEERSLYTRAKAKSPALHRQRISARYKPLFREAAQTIVNKECLAIGRIVKKEERANEDTVKKIAKFYKGHSEYVRQKLAPVMRSYADAINEAASSEIQIDAIDIDKFVNDYLDRYSERHIDSSLGQLVSLLEEEVEEIEQRLNEWHEKRSDKIANNETSRLNNAIAMTVFAAAGYKLVSRVTSSKPCEMCSYLDGMIVEAGKPMVKDGEEIGGIKSYGSKLHPPFHASCNCVVVAG